MDDQTAYLRSSALLGGLLAASSSFFAVGIGMIYLGEVGGMGLVLGAAMLWSMFIADVSDGWNRRLWRRLGMPSDEGWHSDLKAAVESERTAVFDGGEGTR